MRLARITAFRLVTAQIDGLARFYDTIGFRRRERVAISSVEMRRLGLKGGGERLSLGLGDQRLDLDAFEDGGRAYPSDADAASTLFQHLALVTDDAAAAFGRAMAAGARPISRGGVVTLPPSSGGVTAVKFRDPEGHPLEFLQFPPGHGGDWSGRGVLGIDHSAIGVSNLEASRAFYAGHGLAEEKGSLNTGPEQDALDGLTNVRVRVVPMKPATAPPHLELLAYTAPKRSGAPVRGVNDVASTRIVWRGDGDALITDPDGHLHQVCAGA